mmetsp:Transcript_56765/g.65420  ORF Transcript_56765/g.65420 Transcript_56765/m.65420 type:complete len:353 (+) Transcript_56765:270-1328(+)
MMTLHHCSSTVLMNTSTTACLLLLLLLTIIPSHDHAVEGFVPTRSLLQQASMADANNDGAANEGAIDANANDDSRLLDAILWDMDGVLAETERDGHRVAFNQVFDAYELGDPTTNWSVEEYGKLLEVGGGKERMTAHWNEVGWPRGNVKNGFFFDPCDQDMNRGAGADEGFVAQRDLMRQSKVLELHLAKTDVFNTIIRQGTVPLRPGVERLIDAAINNDNITLAVCSTSNEKAVRNLVTTLLGPDRAKKFTIFAGDVVKNKKPAPDIYNLAIETLQLDKSRCLIVEDSGIGFKAAMAADVCCIVTKSVYTNHEDFTGADLIVTDLEGSDGDSEPVTLATIEGLLQQRNNIK